MKNKIIKNAFKELGEFAANNKEIKWAPVYISLVNILRKRYGTILPKIFKTSKLKANQKIRRVMLFLISGQRNLKTENVANFDFRSLAYIYYRAMEKMAEMMDSDNYEKVKAWFEKYPITTLSLIINLLYIDDRKELTRILLEFDTNKLKYAIKNEPTIYYSIIRKIWLYSFADLIPIIILASKTKVKIPIANLLLDDYDVLENIYLSLDSKEILFKAIKNSKKVALINEHLGELIRSSKRITDNILTEIYEILLKAKVKIIFEPEKLKDKFDYFILIPKYKERIEKAIIHIEKIDELFGFNIESIITSWIM